MADQTATISAQYVELLSAEERQHHGFTHRIRIPYTEVYSASLTTQGDTKTLTLLTTPTKFFVRNVALDRKTAYATTGTLTVAIGTSSDPDNYIDEIDAKTAGFRIDALGGDPLTLAGSFGSASVSITAQFATASGALSDITAGEVVVLIDLVDVSKLVA